MYIEEPHKNKNGELISHVYFTEEEAELLDEEDKKRLEPCNITIEPTCTAEREKPPKQKEEIELGKMLETGLFIALERQGMDLVEKFGEEYVNEVRMSKYYKELIKRKVEIEIL